jgi:hypothetical protein
MCRPLLCALPPAHRYWYPLSFFLSLSFQPTALIGLNTDLALPKFSVIVNTRPSLFAYLPPITAEKKEEVRLRAVLARRHLGVQHEDSKQARQGSEEVVQGGCHGDHHM